MELESEGVRFISRDPGDMDTPLHRLAVPDADTSTLLKPAASAQDITRAILETLPARVQGKVAA